MTVAELIAELEKIEDKSLPVWVRSPWEGEQEEARRVEWEDAEYSQPERIAIETD